MAVLRPREGGLRRGENFWLRLTLCSVCVSSESFFPLLVQNLLNSKNFAILAEVCTLANAILARIVDDVPPGCAGTHSRHFAPGRRRTESERSADAGAAERRVAARRQHD